VTSRHQSQRTRSRDPQTGLGTLCTNSLAARWVAGVVNANETGPGAVRGGRGGGGDRGVVSSIKSRIRVGMCIMQNEKYVNPFEDVLKKAKAFKDHARETNKKDEELREKQAVRDAEPQRSPKTGQ
jgi:hypothetical protein